ncbi:ABC transporter ATP-binding protein [Brachybacterium sp. NBEC-018]|uniref:ABC transporter ATP-binding protein n=1 Tax=Brachybacterium sp. NBEC-018 TaxID=2996004 RepID=UPI002175345E|nr:ABC transporter ATP-binding protein [Brachybacterium sp. NBEC-018]UVY84014.1 ABC transporter ATP-binding protein [Brachybacterium sp. NBEC-018]
MDQDDILTVRGLDVEYATPSGPARVLQDVDLDVRRGEILGIAGESGSGKTTLAVTLLRLLKAPGRVASGSATFRPEAGPEVDLLGIDAGRMRSLRWRNISYLPQGSMNSLNPVIRIRDQFRDVILEHEPQRRRGLDAHIAGLLEQVGLSPAVARMYPHELSGGMKQRVLMAMCMALEPDIVVADEPTTALDVTIQRVVLQLLADLVETYGSTVILISHDMGVHAQLVDRIAVMNEGRVVEVGDVRQVFKDPRDPYTRSLIESIPTMEGTVAGGIDA